LAHPRGVGAERVDADAAEPFLAGLVREPAAEVDLLPVRDSGRLDRCGEGVPVELRVATRARVAADVDERLDAGLAQQRDELLEGDACRGRRCGRAGVSIEASG
jgi:hypothetical protein